MLGGLARRTSYILGERSRNGHMLVVDSGNLFSESALEKVTDQERKIADLLIKSYHRMGIDAMNVGMTEASMGPDFFNRPEVKKLPWISSNLVDGKGKYVFEPYLVRKVNSIRIGIIGLTCLQGDPVVKKKFGSNYSVVDPLSAARKVIRAISEKVDVILLLACLVPDETRRLTAENPGICFILGGGEGRTTVTPLRESDTPVLRSGKDGMYVGRLDLTCTASVTQFLDAEEENKLHLEIQGLEQRIAVMKKAWENRNSPALEKMLGDLESKKSAAEQELIKICACSTETGKFLWSLVPMESDLPEDEAVLEWIREAGPE